VATLRLEIVTVEGEVYSDEVNIVVAPGSMGQLGILPNHAPLITMLQPGELMVRKNGEEMAIALSGGFLEVLHNKVTVLADTAERAEDVDVARADAARRRAEELLKSHPPGADLFAAEAALRRSLARLKAAERRRRRGTRVEQP